MGQQKRQGRDEKRRKITVRRNGSGPADIAWHVELAGEFKAKFVEEDDLKVTKGAALTQACFTLVADPNESVREAATECLWTDAEAVADKPGCSRLGLTRPMPSG